MALSNAERQRRYREPQPRVHDRRDRRTRHQQWHDATATIIALHDAWQAWRDAMPEALEASPTAERLDEVLRSATGLRPRLTAAVGQCRRMDPSRNTVDLPCRSLRNGPGAAPTYAQPGHHHRLDCTTEDLDSRTREDRQARVMWRGRWPGMTGQLNGLGAMIDASRADTDATLSGAALRLTPKRRRLRRPLHKAHTRGQGRPRTGLRGPVRPYPLELCA